MRSSVLPLFLSVLILVSAVPILSSYTDAEPEMDIEPVHSGKEIVVSKDGTGDHTNIQDGVDAASAGDVIRVYDGEYKESVNIDKSIVLLGNGTDRTILDGDNVLDHKHLFNVMSDSVNISGFQFREGSPHHEFAGIGVYSSKVNINNNLFKDNNNGIYLGAGQDNIISNNTFDTNGYGIRSDMGCDDNYILDNTFNSSQIGAIIYMGAMDVKVLRNDFNGNRYHISLFNSQGFDIGHNLFNGSDPDRSGLTIGRSMGNCVHNNTFRESCYGIGFSTGGDDNDVMFNTFESNEEGIKTYTSVNGIKAHNNSFINNTAFGINWSASSFTIDARYNWWGNYTGPYEPITNPYGSGDNISVNVTYRPWLLGEFKNLPPFLERIGNTHIYEDSTLDLTLNTSDPDGHGVTVVIKTNASWIEFNTTTLNLRGTPDNMDVGIYYVKINVTDGWGGSTEENFTLTVENTPPEILRDSLPNALEGQEYRVRITHQDEEGALWFISSNASWLDFDSDNVTLYGTPERSDMGSYFVRILIDDRNGGYDEVNLTLTVVGLDYPPEMVIPLDPIQFLEDDEFHMDLSDWAVDIDTELTGYSFNGMDNITVSFDLENRTTTIMPVPDWSGFGTGNFTAYFDEMYISQSIMIDVIPTGDRPEDLHIAPTADPIREGDMFYLNGSAKDRDLPYGDVLSYGWSSNISGPLGNGRSILIELPAGSHLISLTVTDTYGLWESVSEVVIVNKAQREDDGNGTIPVNDSEPDDNTTDPEGAEDNSTTSNDDEGPNMDEDDSGTSDDDEGTDEDGEGNGSPISTFLYILLGCTLLFLLMTVSVLISSNIRRSKSETEDQDIAE